MSNIIKRFTKFAATNRKGGYRNFIIVFSLGCFIILLCITALLIKSSGKTGLAMDSKLKSTSASQSFISAYSGLSTSDEMLSNQSSDSLEEYNSDNNPISEPGQFESSNSGQRSSIRSSKEANSSSARQSSGQPPDYIPLGIESIKGEKIMNDTVEYFIGRSSFLSKSLSESSFYFLERLLDETSQTKAFIIAKDENYALNLNGYFYYLLDRTSSSDIVSPFVLNISVLFDESSRDEVFRSGEYAQRKHLNALKNSLSAALGKYYTEEAYEFIYQGYKETFVGRINGQPSKASLYKMKVNDLEIVFHNSFLTYVEFYIVRK